jgi:hypothetical protein
VAKLFVRWSAHAAKILTPRLSICNRLDEEIRDWPIEAEAERCSM